MWFYPDGSRILELSTTLCAPRTPSRSLPSFARFSRAVTWTLSGEQQTKTRKALDYFASSLQNVDR